MATLAQIRKINKEAKTMPSIIPNVNNGKVFVLRLNDCYRRNGSIYEYYTGKKPTTSIGKAKYFTQEKAKNVRKYAHTGHLYDVHCVPEKQLFLMILQGK